MTLLSEVWTEYWQGYVEEGGQLSESQTENENIEDIIQSPISAIVGHYGSESRVNGKNNLLTLSS